VYSKIYYPLFLDLNNQDVLLIGSGEMAEEKLPKLVEAKANITLIDYVIDPETRHSFPSVHYIEKAWCLDDLRPNYRLIFSALGNAGVNAVLREACNTRHILFNAVDNPENCDYILPAVLRRGSLVIAISSTGISPILAQKMREQIRNLWGNELDDLIRWMPERRETLKTLTHNADQRKEFWQEFFEKDPLLKVKTSGLDAVDELWKEMINELNR
jgi:siroheme synthase-like protein